MTLSEAARRGVVRVRLPHWADPTDYLKIDIVDGGLGPWVHLYSRHQQPIGEPTPQSILLVCEKDWDAVEAWEPYDGQLLES